MEDRGIVLFIFVVYGLVAAFRPEWMARFQTWTNMKILGAKFVPSKRTLNWYRGMGILFLVLGVWIWFKG